MSAPPRTEVRAEKRGIADRIVVFSLLYALTASGVLEAPELPEKLPKGRNFRTSHGIAPPTCASRSARAGHHQATFSPESASPKPLPIAADFLIGWRVGIYDRRLATSVPIRKLLPECKLAARVISTFPAATPI